MDNETDRRRFLFDTSLIRPAAWIFSVCLVYFITARFSLSLLFEPEDIAAVWPPAGIFLSAILLSKRSVRPFLAAALFVTDWIAETLVGTSLLLGGVYALSLAGDAVLGAWLMIRFLGEPVTFRKARNVIGFLVMAVIFSNCLMSLVAAAAVSKLLPAAPSFWHSWRSWATSDGIGNLIVTPLILSWAYWARTGRGRRDAKWAVEGISLLILMAVLNFYAFHYLSDFDLFTLLIPYLTFPFMLWAAVRFGMRGVSAALFTFTVIAVHSAVQGHIPHLSSGGSPLDAALMVQMYLVIIAVPSLMIAAFITERQHAEDTLRESEMRLNKAEEIAHLGSWEFDIIADQLIWSDEVYRILGLSPQDSAATYQDFMEAVHPDDRAAVDAAYSGSIRDGKDTYEIEHRIVRKSTGEIRHVQEKCEHIRDASGRIVRSLGMMHDVTDLKRGEEALRKSHEKYRAIFDDLPIAIWEEDFSTVKERLDELRLAGTTDLRSYLDMNPGETANLAALVRVVDINKASVQIFGAGNKEQLFRELPSYFTPEAMEVFKEELIALAAGRTSFRREAVHLNVQDKPVVFDLNLNVQPGHERTLSRVLVSFVDITERRRAEEAREKLQAQLLQSQKMESVGRLAGGIAHDFNNMLGVILGHVELALERTEAGAPLRLHLEEIMKAGQRSADLTSQLLAFARKQTVVPKVLNMNDTVAGMLKMLKRLIGEDIDIAWMPQAELWPVKMDPAQIDQILANLFLNARDAIAGLGRITIETGNVVFDEAYCGDHHEFTPGSYVMLAVSDDGCGMNGETIEHLFEPFFTTKMRGQGTGLGLATVYGIVKQNNGFINVYSETGRGTTFKIYLPFCKTEDAAVQPSGPKRAAKRGTETILFVEDEKMLLDLGRAMLETLGYRVLATNKPEEAIAMAKGHADDIELIITDVILPEMNGRELSERIRTIKPGIRCLFMSGYTANVIAHHGVLEEGMHFIQKPFSLENLAAKVRETLSLTADV